MNVKTGDYSRAWELLFTMGQFVWQEVEASRGRGTIGVPLKKGRTRGRNFASIALKVVERATVNTCAESHWKIPAPQAGNWRGRGSVPGLDL